MVQIGDWYPVALSFVQSGIGQALIIAAITALAARIFAPKGKLVWGCLTNITIEFQTWQMRLSFQ